MQQSWEQSQGQPGLDCPVVELLPVLLDLLAETHQRPAAQLSNRIRRLLIEQHRDHPDAPAPQRSDLEQQTERICGVLEQVRHLGLEQGAWSAVPVTPQMFG